MKDIFILATIIVTVVGALDVLTIVARNYENKRR